MPQPCLRIWPLLPELLQRPAGYQAHRARFSQNAKPERNGIFRNMRRSTVGKQKTAFLRIWNILIMLPWDSTTTRFCPEF
jgi:hypothetical protein